MKFYSEIFSGISITSPSSSHKSECGPIFSKFTTISLVLPAPGRFTFTRVKSEDASTKCDPLTTCLSQND